MVCSVALVVLTACPNRSGGGGSGADTEDGSDTSSSTTESETVTPTTSTTTSDESSSSGPPPPEQCETPGGYPWGADPVIPADCDDPVIDDCREDQDRDGVSFTCDNAIDRYNPEQRDVDGDTFGDAEDLCPVIAGEGDLTLDSDTDGIGSACDNCRQGPDIYNGALVAAPDFMLVRNVPAQLDTDRDGIGDPCDNCPTVANCGGFGADDPAAVGDAVPWDDPALCQADADVDGIGDACEGMAGMGLAATDDLDGDGLSNADDPCPRYAADTDDSDGDGVGDACDTCPWVANPMQIANRQADDPDEDFVGAACETNFECEERRDARPIGFFDVSVDGFCCVTVFPSDAELRDPDGVRLRAECSADDEAAGTCRPLPASALEAPGVVSMPPGCDAYLAPGCEAHEVTLDDVGGDPIALWDYACLLPSWDADFDGLGDVCDLCPFAFDPTNRIYVDINGMEWPNDGWYCNGDYLASTLDPANGCLP